MLRNVCETCTSELQVKKLRFNCVYFVKNNSGDRVKTLGVSYENKLFSPFRRVLYHLHCSVYHAWRWYSLQVFVSEFNYDIKLIYLALANYHATSQYIILLPSWRFILFLVQVVEYLKQKGEKRIISVFGPAYSNQSPFFRPTGFDPRLSFLSYYFNLLS